MGASHHGRLGTVSWAVRTSGPLSLSGKMIARHVGHVNRVAKKPRTFFLTQSRQATRLLIPASPHSSAPQRASTHSSQLHQGCFSGEYYRAGVRSTQAKSDRRQAGLRPVGGCRFSVVSREPARPCVNPCLTRVCPNLSAGPAQRVWIPASTGAGFAALQRRDILLFWQQGPREVRRIEPKETKEGAKMAMRRASSAYAFFRFFSAMVIWAAGEGRPQLLAMAEASTGERAPRGRERRRNCAKQSQFLAPWLGSRDRDLDGARAPA